MTYPNEALTHVCRILLDEWELTPEQIASLARDIPRECDGILENRPDVVRDRQRRAMIEAGREHLLR